VALVGSVLLGGAVLPAASGRALGLAGTSRSDAAPGPASGRAGPSVSALPPNPFSDGMNASVALGQANFTYGAGGLADDRLGGPDAGIAFNATGSLWVVDGGNNRVLAFNPPFTTGKPAELVLGQPGFTTRGSNTNQTSLWEPQGIAIDAHGDVWVADSTNNRVLEYVPPFTSGMPASLVLGQLLYTTRAAGTSATAFTHPTGLAFNSQGDLFVADSLNNRVLEFVPSSSGFTPDMPATYVLGQTSFASSSTAVTDTNLSDPTAVAVGPGGNLWVADTGNKRALEFLAPISTGKAASIVLGQTGFTTSTQGLPLGLYSPQGVAVDPQGDVWVSDRELNRTTEYLPPYSDNEAPAAVIGQLSISKVVCATTQSGECAPSSVAVDPSGDLWVFDDGNTRVLEYVPSVFSWTFSETGLRSGTKWSVTVDGTTLSNTTSGGSGTILFAVRNGSHSFTVGSVSGYSSTPRSGSYPMNGSTVVTTVAFSTTILGLSPAEFALLLLLLLVIVAAIVAVVLMRRRLRGRSAPPPLKPSPSTPAPPPPPASGPAGPPSP
jgi:sugar lactone lactonase YvrE